MTSIDYMPKTNLCGAGLNFLQSTFYLWISHSELWAGDCSSRLTHRLHYLCISESLHLHMNQNKLHMAHASKFLLTTRFSSARTLPISFKDQIFVNLSHFKNMGEKVLIDKNYEMIPIAWSICAYQRTESIFIVLIISQIKIISKILFLRLFPSALVFKFFHNLLMFL